MDPRLRTPAVGGLNSFQGQSADELQCRKKVAHAGQKGLKPFKARVGHCTFSAITRQPLWLERCCSNPLQMRQVFQFRLKFFKIWVWGSSGGCHKVGMFLNF